MRIIISFLLATMITSSLFCQPKLFMPKVFEGLPNIRDIAISPNQDEIYFTIDDYKYKIGVIACIQKQGNKWGKPKVVSFSGNFRDIEPAFSSDGNRLYFSSNRPLDKDSITLKDYDIWYVERNNQKSPWSSPKNLGAPINTAEDEFYPSITVNGDIYFTSGREGTKGKEDIFVSRLKNGSYAKPESISEGVNTASYEFNAYVSPKEDFIIFTSIRKGEGSGRGDLYISFKDKDKKWSKANLLKNANSLAMDYCPFVDITNNKLYFTSLRSNIKNYYSKKLSYLDILKIYNEEPNGKSRLYKTEFRIEDFRE